MSTVQARASVVLGKDSSPNTSFRNPTWAVDGSFGQNNGTWAQWSNSVATAVGHIDLGFGSQFAGIPDGSQIVEMSITLRHYESAVPNIQSLSLHIYDGTTSISGPRTITRGTSARSDTVIINPTLAQVRSPDFKVRVNTGRDGSTTAGILYIDYVDATVTYIPPVLGKIWNGIEWIPAEIRIWNGVQWRTDAKAWDGNEWVSLGG